MFTKFRDLFVDYQLNKEPWKPTPYKSPDVHAIVALSRGVATPDQQQRALEWIVTVACGTYDQSYRAGVDGERDTAFAEGKRHVGNTIVKMTRVKSSNLRRAEEHEQA